MKRYYSETIPTELGVKLQDAGMKVEWEDNTPIDYPLVPNIGCLTTYAEVIDWLREMGLEVEVRRSCINVSEWWSGIFHIINDNSSESVQVRKDNKWLYTPDWFEAANAGIETALKMLKEGKK